MLTINKALVAKEYIIDHINYHLNLELGIRLNHLGFLESEKIKVLSKTPFTGDSLLVEIRGSQMALTKSEAELINIKELA
jgi:Fe2+ transport system protein FeoA